MLSVFITILPVFLVLGAGYIAARLGYLAPEISDALNAFTIKLAVPSLLFAAMYRLDLGQAYNLPLLAGFYIGAVISFVSGIVLARLIWKRRPGEAVAVGFCALFSNTVLLALPIQERAYGAASLVPVFGIISLHASTLYILGMTAMEFAKADGRPLGATVGAALKSVLANPLMIGILAGLAFNFLDIELPEPVFAAVQMIAKAAIPAALVGIGIALTRYQLKADFSEALMVAMLSLVLHPLIAYLLTHHLFGLDITYVRAAVITAAMPPGMNVYIFASMYNRAVSLSASAIVVATAMSIATIAFWIWLLEMTAV